MRILVKVIAHLWPFARVSISERLAASLRPRPDLRDRRFSQWSKDRRQRYMDACYGVPQSLRRVRGLTAGTPYSPVSGITPDCNDTGVFVSSGAGPSAAKKNGIGQNTFMLDRTCDVSPVIKHARISNPIKTTKGK